MGRNTLDPTATIEAKRGAATAADATRPPDSLQNQLREKDQLVAALTERLEQAAEQLDRLRRTGVDKGRRPVGGATVPAELLQDQKQTLDDLKRFVGEWDQKQPTASLERIEAQLSEIRGLIASEAAQFASATRERPASTNPPAAATAGGSPPPAGKSTNNSSWWEKQKAALLGDGPSPASAEPAEKSPPPSEVAASEPAPDTVRPTCSLNELVIPEPPTAVDFESVTLDDAKQAIRERDQLIQQLRETLLLLQASGQFPNDLPTVESLPAALRERLEQLETQWQAKFRQAELDLSLERARLAREQTQIQLQQETLQKQLRQGGNTPRERLEGEAAEDGASRRRWFRFMGKSDDAGKEPPTRSED
jgi:hypothetical protein